MREEAPRFGNDTSTFSTPDARLHTLRRGAVNQFFSRQRILTLEDTVREKLEKLIQNTRAFTAEGKALNIQDAWAAFVGDVITRYCFAYDYDHLSSQAFLGNWTKVLHTVMHLGHLSCQYPIIPAFMNSLPDILVEKTGPEFATVINFKRDLRREIISIRNQTKAEGKADGEQLSIFSSILENEQLPPREKQTERLVDESMLLIPAGLLTTAWALSVGSFHIINNKPIYKKLREELDRAIPNSTNIDTFQWSELERLPYLTGCIKESIRMSRPVVHRSQRLYDHPIKYRQWTIPPQTPIGMNLSDVCLDENLFPDATTFDPERWIDNEQTKYGPRLEKFFLFFSKGPRSCLGQNLAWCELYLGMAAMFRNFEFELYETDVMDAEVAHDFWLPSAKLDSKGVRVKRVN